jgi:hypothetical protein
MLGCGVPDTRTSIAKYVGLAFACLILIALAVALLSGPGHRSEPIAGPQPSLVGVPTLPPEPAAPPIFETWLKYEPKQVAEQAVARDYFVDGLLGHQVFQLPPAGLPPMQAGELMLEDDELLLSSGRHLWTRELLHSPGLSGKFCYLHSRYCVSSLFDTEFFVDGRPAIVYANTYSIERYPSHTLVRHELAGVRIEERKFITWDDRAVATYDVTSTDKKPHDVTIEVRANYLPIAGARTTPSYPLLGSGGFQGRSLFVYLDAPDFGRTETAAIHLHRTLAVPAEGAAPRTQIAVAFEAEARRSTPPLPADLYERHRREYQHWFADNVPYFDSSDPGFKRMWYYRWWIVRFNMNRADTPDLRGYSFYEGKLGFDNVISFAVPVQLKELTYLRNAQFGLDQALNSYRNLADNGAVVDPPGSPYWGETYSHWIASALAEYHRVHPIPQETLRALLPAMAGDVRAWMTAYDADRDGLPQRSKPRVTGYDLDILSFWYFSGLRFDEYADLKDLERVDFASFVFANAAAVAELAGQVGDQALAAEFRATADRIRKASLDHLWDDKTRFFYPQRAEDDARIPVRELHGFFPFTTLLAPNEPRYTAALEKFIDPDEFWARFPPVITSTAHYREWNWRMDGLTRNIAPHPITMGSRTLIQALKHYPGGPIKPAHLMEQLRRYNDLVYPGVNPYDPYWRPNAYEYFSKWEPNQISRRPKPSDISHDFHSAYCYMIVEGAVGLTPRDDDQIEIRPAALEWDYFLLDRLRYRGHDLTIAWDRPDGKVRYEGIPEGFSLRIDGKQAFSRSNLEHVVYDPATQQVAAGAAD